MSITKVSDNRTGVTDPLVSFSFQVSLGNASNALARCSAVDGLSKEIEMIEYRESVSPNIVHFRQGRRKAPRVTIKKAYLIGGTNNALYDWVAQADNGGVIVPQDVIITVGSYGSDVNPSNYAQHAERNFGGKNVWVLSACRPVKWSIGSLDGNSNGLILESLELVAEEIRLTK